MLWRTRVNPVPGCQGPMATRGIWVGCIRGASTLSSAWEAPPGPKTAHRRRGLSCWLVELFDGDVDLLVVDDGGHELHGKDGGAGEGEGFVTGEVGVVHGGGEDVAVVLDDPARKLSVDLFELGESRAAADLLKEGVEVAVGDLGTRLAVAEAVEEISGVVVVLLDGGGNVDAVTQGVGDRLEVPQVDNHEPPERGIGVVVEVPPNGLVVGDFERGREVRLGGELAKGGGGDGDGSGPGCGCSFGLGGLGGLGHR